MLYVQKKAFCASERRTNSISCLAHGEDSLWPRWPVSFRARSVATPEKHRSLPRVGPSSRSGLLCLGPWVPKFYLLLHLLPLLDPWTFRSTKRFYLGPCSPFKSTPQKIILHIFHMKSKISLVSLRLTERINLWMTLEVGKPEQQTGRSCKRNVLNACMKHTSLHLLEFTVAFLTQISI